MVGHRLRLSTSSLLEVGFRFEFFSQFVFAKVFNRDSGFRDYLGFFFFLNFYSWPHQLPQSVRLLLGA